MKSKSMGEIELLMNHNDSPVRISGAHTRPLHSSFVNDTYELTVWLPDSYGSSDQTYSTLYVLDSAILFGSAIEAARLKSWDTELPEMIIVGIGQETPDRWEYCRWRDYSPVPFPNIPGSGYGDNYLGFLEQECLPFIEANYRTKPDDRIIWGTSMGGLFALYVLFNKSHLFRRYIANAPAFVIDDIEAFDYRPALAADSLPSEVSLFVSVGSLDQEFLANAKSFMAALESNQLANLRFQTMIIDNLGHSGSVVPTFYYGIEAVYRM